MEVLTLSSILVTLLLSSNVTSVSPDLENERSLILVTEDEIFIDRSPLHSLNACKQEGSMNMTLLEVRMVNEDGDLVVRGKFGSTYVITNLCKLSLAFKRNLCEPRILECTRSN